MRHTKIIATIGPASDSDAVLDALIAAGGAYAKLYELQLQDDPTEPAP